MNKYKHRLGQKGDPQRESWCCLDQAKKARIKMQKRESLHESLQKQYWLGGGEVQAPYLASQGARVAEYLG